MSKSGLLVRLMDSLKDYPSLEVTVNGHRFHGTPTEYDLSGVTFRITEGVHVGTRANVPYKYLEDIRPLK
jgi:hypothetical protein